MTAAEVLFKYLQYIVVVVVVYAGMYSRINPDKNIDIILFTREFFYDKSRASPIT
jgi:hypothetical protein